jgi:hypothetical protein
MLAPTNFAMSRESKQMSEGEKPDLSPWANSTCQ